MFARQLRRVKLNKYEVSGDLDILKGQCLRLSTYEAAPNPADDNQAPRKLKEWRAQWDTGRHKIQTKFKIFDRGSRPSMDFIAMMNAPWDVSRDGLARWWKRKSKEMEVFDQRFVRERHQILGSNLATAHFLVHRGAKVKFYGQPEWVEKDENDEYKLPDKYEPGYLLEAIDAKSINLHYVGLGNMCNLHDLKSLSLRGCKPIDDWCLDRISNQYPKLDYLDVSNCPEVSERGLEALYRMQSLRTLIITNHHNSPAFELTCMMLEDCSPGLRCEILPPEPKKENKKDNE